jgi:multiple sugar transport system substrate-binding protein
MKDVVSRKDRSKKYCCLSLQWGYCMKKRELLALYVLCAALGAILSLTGCSWRSRQQGVPAKTIVRYENWENLPQQVKLHQEVVDTFNRSQKEVYVKFVPVQGGPDKIKVEMAGGAAPDVFYWIDALLPPLAKKGAVADISGLIKESKFDVRQYHPVLLDGVQYGDKIYGLPIYYGASALVYNKDMFDECRLSYPDEAWTWEDFRKAAKKLLQSDNAHTKRFGALAPDAMSIIRSFGGELFDASGLHCLIDSNETRQALRFLLALKNVDKAVPSAAEMGGDDFRNGVQMFMGGRVGMFIAPSYILTSLADIKSFSWDVAPLPLALDGKRRGSFSTGTLHISSQSKVKEAAFRFMQFACGPEGTAILGKGRNCIPPIADVARKTFCVPPPEHISIYIDALEYARPSPKITWLREYNTTVFQPEMELLFMGRQNIDLTLKRLEVKAREFAAKE